LRDNRQQLLEAFKKHLSTEEIKSLGVDLPAGADHYRAFVGPPFIYDVLGALQFMFLIELGLREHNTVLDIGCGSLRLGRLLIPFLLPDRYFGVEPNARLVEEGLIHNFGAGAAGSQIVALKRPKFSFNADFDFSIVRPAADFVMAQSIASHTGVKETGTLFRNTVTCMSDHGVAMITYMRCVKESDCNTKDGWFYPESVTYTDTFFKRLAKAHGVWCYRSVWPMANRTEVGPVSPQTPLIVTKRPWRPSHARRLAGIDLEGVVQVGAPI
jgi:hypothetical protein